MKHNKHKELSRITEDSKYGLSSFLMGITTHSAVNSDIKEHDEYLERLEAFKNERYK